MTTDTTERGLEDLICAALCSRTIAEIRGGVVETPEPFVGLNDYVLGAPSDYDRDYAVDLKQLAIFLKTTQPDAAEAADLQTDGPTRRKFLNRLQGEVSKRGVVDVLRHGVSHGPAHVEMFYGSPSAGNVKAEALHALNRFSVTRQLRYSRDERALALDLAIFVNGLPLFTFELKNSLTKQTVDDAGHAEHSGDLRKFIEGGKKIVITTVQKFPFVLNDIGDAHRNSRFAIIIDEAHSSQGGKTASAMSQALGRASDDDDDDETLEDQINRLMEAKKMLANASYFAFTATPKNKTLEIFGTPHPEGDHVEHRPFHHYTMKQAVQEGFILDVLENYTPINSYYRLVKTIEVDPEFDTKRATKKLRKFVESHDHAIRLKAEIMVDHFHEQVLALNKIGGEARAMVVTSGIERAIQYYQAFKAYLVERKSPYKAIVAFSGEHEYGGAKVTEATLNGFPSKDIADQIEQDPYRFLICADKFQTGYDQPLLHTMYVDKALSGVKAVQTLSRLNRAHPKKHDVFVLDFLNEVEGIKAAFEPYYRTTVLSDETDPNKLHDLKSALDGALIYDRQQIDTLVGLYLGGADRDRLDPILDACVATYIEDLDEDGQVDFKGKAKAFVRTYGFLSTILPYTNGEWEKLSIFLNFLIPKLPAPKEEDLSKGVLEAIDMDSYRVEKQATQKVQLADADGVIDPASGEGGGHASEPELDRLSNILETFNALWGGVDWEDKDRIRRLITDEIPDQVAADPAYQNARAHSDKEAARHEHDRALQKVIINRMKDDGTLFKQFSDNEDFRRWLSDTIFSFTYGRGAAPRGEGAAKR